MKVLHIDSSIMADASVSRQLSQAIVSQLSEKHAQVEVEYLDLETQPIPHLDAEILMGQNAEQSALGERIIQQYLDADVVVIGAAMYNFGITSTLKAWIDRISVAGRTFKYVRKMVLSVWLVTRKPILPVVVVVSMVKIILLTSKKAS